MDTARSPIHPRAPPVPAHAGPADRPARSGSGSFQRIPARQRERIHRLHFGAGVDRDIPANPPPTPASRSPRVRRRDHFQIRAPAMERELQTLLARFPRNQPPPQRQERPALAAEHPSARNPHCFGKESDPDSGPRPARARRWLSEDNPSPSGREMLRDRRAAAAPFDVASSDRSPARSPRQIWSTVSAL